MGSNRGQQWNEFAADVLSHIENYTVPQYGDYPDDQAEQFTIQDIKAQLQRYINRIGRNARGISEEIRDCHKIAHYACMLKSKLQGEKIDINV